MTDKMKILLTLLWQMPLASVSDLASRHELAVMSRTAVNDALKWLYSRDYVGFADRGWSQKAKPRYYLHAKGIAAVMNMTGEPLEWGVTETALKRFLRQGQLLEMVYDTAPGLFSSNAVDEARRRDFPLTRLRWLSRGPVAAVAEYGFNSPGNGAPPRRVVPYVWYGIRPKPNRLPGNLAEWSSVIATGPDGRKEAPEHLCGVVILAADRLAGMRARKDLDPDVPRAIVVGNSHGGSLVEPMAPRACTVSVNNAGSAPAHYGQPERIETYLEQDPVQANVLGRTEHLILTAVEEWPGCSASQLGRLCGHPASKARGVARRFAEAGLVDREENGRLYPTELTQKLAVDRDRLGHRKTRGRAGAERSPGGERRAHMSRHESGVVELACRFREMGIFVAAGWRMVINYPDLTQIAPDLWALVPINDGRAAWHAVEFERTATSARAITKKIRPYRTALDIAESQPLLMVCETEAAASRFAAVGREMPMCVAVYRETLTRPFTGPNSPWRHDGEPVDVGHLRYFPLWSQTTRESMEYILVERRDLYL